MNVMTKQAVLFFDLDGTLIANRNEVAPGVLAALKQLRQRGHLTFLCTGRPLCTTPDSLRQGILTGTITLAGARVQIGEKVLCQKTIPPALLRQTVEEMLRRGISAIFESSEGCCCLVPPNTTCPQLMGSGMVAVSGLSEMERHFPGLGFSKIVFWDRDLAKVHAGGRFFLESYSLCDIAVGCHELALPEVTKREAVLLVLKELGREAGESYGFGDSENDLPMLQVVGTAVAMGNALPAVKAAADYVTDSVARDGVPKALRHFGLIE